MTGKINIAKSIQYWIKTSEHDYETKDKLGKIKKFYQTLCQNLKLKK